MSENHPQSKRYYEEQDGPTAGNTRYRLTPISAAMLAAIYPFSQADAQQSEGAGRLEEITVTATRREKSLQDLGQSVTAFTAKAIERQAFMNMNDYVAAIPSINMESVMPGRNSVVMRGVSTGTGEYRTDNQVSVYLDDAPLTSINQQVNVRMVDVARIESLPGPQGTLFGSSSQSGTLRIITNKPDYLGFSGQASAYIGTTKGGEESYEFKGHLNIPIIDDRLAVRVVGFSSEDGGYVDNILSDDYVGIYDNSDVVEEDWNKYSVSGGRLAALWNITDRWDVLAMYVTQDSEANGSWDTDEGLGEFQVARFFDEYRVDDWAQTSLTLTGDLGFAEFTLTGADYDRDIQYEWDNTRYDQWRSATTPFPLYDTDYLAGTQFNDQVQKRESYEARLTSISDSRLQWMAGAFYEDTYDRWFYGVKNPDLVDTTSFYWAQYYAYVAKYYYGYDVQYPIPPTDIYYQNAHDKTVKQTAIFGEVTYALNDEWSITGGARWFEFDREEFDKYEIPLGLPVYEGRGSDGSHSSQGTDSDVVYKFGTEYHLDADKMVYALYSEGFRLGGSNSTRAAESGVIPLEYEPDTLQNYEIGFKTQWLNSKLQLNGSLFYMEWQDIQFNDNADDAPFWQTGTINGGTAEQKGLELSGWYYFTDNFYIEGSVFMGDPEFTEDFTLQDGDLIPAGTPMPISPEEKYWVALQYTIPNVGFADSELWFRYDHSYWSETWRSVSWAIDGDRENGTYPQWSSGNFQVGMTLQNDWELTLMARNVWDDRNYGWRRQYGYGEQFGSDLGNEFRSYERPRTISLTVRKAFGPGR